MMRAVILAAALALGGCTTARVIVTCAPPSELMAPAPKPRQLVERVTPLREAVQLWAQDRADAANLAMRMRALQSWVRERCGE